MKNKNKVLTIACIAIVALTSSLVTYAKDKDPDRPGQIRLVLSNGQGIDLQYFVTSLNKKNGNYGDQNFLIRAVTNKSVFIPSDTDEVYIFSMKKD